MAVVSGTGTTSVGFNQVVSSGVITPQTIPASISRTTQYANGTGANQVDLVYAKQLTLAGTPTTLDLTALPDLSGATVNFARVREYSLQVVSGPAGSKVIQGNAAATAWAAFWGATGTDTAHLGTICSKTDPTSVGSGVGAVVTGTSKSLKLDPGADTVVCNLIIAGCSAVS